MLYFSSLWFLSVYQWIDQMSFLKKKKALRFRVFLGGYYTTHSYVGHYTIPISNNQCFMESKGPHFFFCGSDVGLRFARQYWWCFEVKTVGSPNVWVSRGVGSPWWKKVPFRVETSSFCWETTRKHMTCYILHNTRLYILYIYISYLT